MVVKKIIYLTRLLHARERFQEASLEPFVSEVNDCQAKKGRKGNCRGGHDSAAWKAEAAEEMPEEKKMKNARFREYEAAEVGFDPRDMIEAWEEHALVSIELNDICRSEKLATHPTVS